MTNSYSILKFFETIAKFIQIFFIISAIQISIFVFSLYRIFTSSDAENMDMHQWQLIITDKWAASMNNAMLMYTIVIIYLAITAIPMFIMWKNKSHPYRQCKECCSLKTNEAKELLNTKNNPTYYRN
ncbi:hypothetical protein [Aliivibrio fischeri]|uniref:Uncharacterized protein n=1 Tax=Aliivibrio fischeri TaxID=668 RepID=A0A510UN67_ALIFS|nr:hypothetical protein [Aliivibrio fischeri]MUK51111.1 hypothetical protein [Aliivibrio fischeri]GEK16064.1 hypothetical protein AFI02nite_41000 [Aliivibrio fischeri]